MSSQWWLTRFATPASAAFVPINSTVATAGATEAQLAPVVSSAGSCLTLSVSLSAAPGVGNSIRVQVSVNASASTVLDVTISGASTTGSATGTVAIAAGDLVTIKTTPSGSPGTPTVTAWAEFSPTTTDNYCYPCCPGNTLISTAGSLAPLFFPAPYAADGPLTRGVAAMAGQITRFYFNVQTAPGAGHSWVVAILVNSVEQTTLTLSDTNKQVSSTGLSISIAAGDVVQFQIKTDNTASNTRGFAYSVSYVPTVSSVWQIGGNGNGSFSNAAVRYGSVVDSNIAVNATEANVSVAMPANLTLYGAAMAIPTAPTSGKSWAIVSRANNADANTSFSISNAAKSGASSGGGTQVTSGQVVDVSITPSGTPAANTGQQIAMAFSPPGVPGTGSASFPHLTAQGTGQENFIATGAAAFPHITAQGTGNEAPKGIAAIALPHIAASGSATNLPPTGSGDVAFPHVNASGSGIEIPKGVGAISLPNFEASSPDARAHGGHIGGQHFIGHSRDVFFPHFMAQGTGSRSAPSNSGIVLFPHFTAQGSGLRNTNGMGAATFPHLLMLGGVGAQNPAGTGAVAFPHFTALGGTAIGVGIIVFPSFDAQGYSESPIGTGIGGVTFPAFRVQGSQLTPPPLFIVLRSTGPRLATVSIHSPWWPRQRMAILTTANNIDRSYTAVSRLGTKDTGQGACHISNKDAALLRDSGILTHGNLLVITSPVAQPWIGVLATTSEDDSNGQIELSALSYEAVLDGRITPQSQKFTSSFGANAIFGSLVQEANARNHLGLQMPSILEITNPVDDLETGGQSVLEALNELTGRTSSEWWLDYQVSAQAIKSTLRLGFMQGFDLRDSVHLYQGTHFTAQYKQDMSQVKQQVTTVGDFGADLVDRNSVTRVGAFGPEHLGIASAAIHESATSASRRLVSLPAGLRNEKINFEVMTGSTAELSRRSQLVQERPLQAERTFNATFYGNVDFRDVAAGNIVSLWGTWGNVTGRHICRVMGIQPDEEMCSAQAALWELVE